MRLYENRNDLFFSSFRFLQSVYPRGQHGLLSTAVNTYIFTTIYTEGGRDLHCIRRRRSTSNRNVYIYSRKNIMYKCIKEKLVTMNAERTKTKQ